MRSALNENTTSSAVIVVPSWNFTFWRSLTSTVLSSMRVHDVAKPGMSLFDALR
jgi:hypothetical protein